MRDGKFGTFAGVFTPSVLTILGVIMYLRLPWLVGEAGLWMMLGIIGAAHVVSITTGLSVSSIATDKKVGAGGPYYILSRCFGLPIGGAIGLALFVGLCFANALYVIGFSESFLAAIGVEATKDAIRIAGSATLLAVTAITFVSTSLAIKSQYAILGIIAVSLVVIFLGSPGAPAEANLAQAPSSPSFALLFGIFFPAVTGFMSGVNMSGDLRDPKRAILRGTMLAILVAAAIYVGLAVFLAYRVDRTQLREDPAVLQHIALWGPAVVAGIWAATLSSALGGILGAPRILQAMSVDGITPRVLAKGHGATGEPRRALVPAFLLSEVGILIAELNLIARVVAMIYLAQYCFINLTAAIESWASPDFRPRFRVPKLVSVIGAVSALLLMIQLDLLAMLGAVGLMAGLFLYLKRRQLTLESGDTWEGVWSTIVRVGLHRLDRRGGQSRHWRPNVLLFDEVDHPAHPAIRDFASTLASGNGIVTDFALAPPRAGDEEPAPKPPAKGSDDDKIGVFDTRIETTAPLETIATICQHHGFSGVPPNTLLLPWRYHAADAAGFLRAIQAAAARGLNILLFDDARAATRSRPARIDLWWSREAGNLALAVALSRFITRAPQWEQAAITVHVVGEGGDDDELLRARAARHLDAMRVDAQVRVVVRPHGQRLHDLVCNESRPADLVLLGLPDDLAKADAESLERLERVAALPGGIVFVRASDAFADVLVAARAARAATVEPTAVAAPADGAPSLPLPLPAHPELAAAAELIAGHASGVAQRVHDRVAAGYGIYLELCATAREMLTTRTDALVAAAGEADPVRRRRLADRATAAFLSDADRILRDLEAHGLGAHATVLGESLAALTAPGAAIPPTLPAVVHVERPRAEYRAADGESRPLRRWKRRQRWRWFYRRKIPQAIALRPLVQRDHDELVGENVTRILGRFRTASHDLLVEVGRVLANAEWKAHAQLSRAGEVDVEAVVQPLLQGRDEALRRLDGIAAHTRERIAEHRTELDGAVREAVRRLCDSLDRIDAPVAVRAAARAARRRPPADELRGFGDAWRDEQLGLLRRVDLGVRLAGCRDRLTAATMRAAEDIVAGVRASGHRACAALRDALARGAAADVNDELPYDTAPTVARFAQAAARLTADLTETEQLLTDEAAALLTRGDQAAETVTVEVRAAVQALVEAELIARLGAEAQLLTEADARAWATARDTALVVDARPRDADDDDPAEDPVAAAIARLDAQLARIREAEEAFIAHLLEGLGAVAAASGGGMVGSLERRTGRRTNGEGTSRIRALARRSIAGVRDVAANVVYRRSAGIVYADETRAGRARAAEETLRELASRSAISAGVLTSLPVYYRNLFTGQININESFFVGRDAKVRAAGPVVAGERGGGLRTALVSGARGAGKSTLCQQIATAAGGTTHWLSPPPAGAATRAALRSALEAATGMQGTPKQVASRLAPGSVLVVDDLDLWWERRPGGLDAIDELLELVADTGDRVGYVLAGGDPALRVLGALRPLARIVQTRVECQPLAARALEQVIMARHSSTGVRLRLGSRNGEGIGSLARARLFDAHFDYALGNVGFALRSWLAHVDAYADDVLTIRVPRVLDWDAIDDLRAEHVAILVELALHKSASSEKLARTTGRAESVLAEAVADLCAIGLVTKNRRRVVQINPFVHVPVTAWLDRRQLA